MCPAVKSNGFKYYEYVLCYVDDVLCISEQAMEIMKGIHEKNKLKDDQIKEPGIDLGAS